MAGVGSATIDGTLESDAEIGAETIRLGESASIAGDLRYDGDLEGGTPMLSRARFERTPRSGSMLRRRFSRSRRGCSPPMPSR